ncbi:hypothetical protein CBOM_06874 [Ceraceosorus bombacis]|uniref:Uncharacterized protein n=1 Tax=Ceraceosorus bombacis TaxID=401625 RepID=A0A0P1BTU0_9BASI|nr:hypothetical protein CBOM_06874 [Ceraceosorus bombacis]
MSESIRSWLYNSSLSQAVNLASTPVRAQKAEEQNRAWLNNVAAARTAARGKGGVGPRSPKAKGNEKEKGNGKARAHMQGNSTHHAATAVSPTSNASRAWTLSLDDVPFWPGSRVQLLKVLHAPRLSHLRSSKKHSETPDECAWVLISDRTHFSYAMLDGAALRLFANLYADKEMSDFGGAILALRSVRSSIALWPLPSAPHFGDSTTWHPSYARLVLHVGAFDLLGSLGESRFFADLDDLHASLIGDPLKPIQQPSPSAPMTVNDGDFTLSQLGLRDVADGPQGVGRIAEGQLANLACLRIWFAAASSEVSGRWLRSVEDAKRLQERELENQQRRDDRAARTLVVDAMLAPTEGVPPALNGAEPAGSQTNDAPVPTSEASAQSETRQSTSPEMPPPGQRPRALVAFAKNASSANYAERGRAATHQERGQARVADDGWGDFSLSQADAQFTAEELERDRELIDAEAAAAAHATPQPQDESAQLSRSSPPEYGLSGFQAKQAHAARTNLPSQGVTATWHSSTDSAKVLSSSDPKNAARLPFVDKSVQKDSLDATGSTGVTDLMEAAAQASAEARLGNRQRDQAERGIDAAASSSTRSAITHSDSQDASRPDLMLGTLPESMERLSARRAPKRSTFIPMSDFGDSDVEMDDQDAGPEQSQTKAAGVRRGHSSESLSHLSPSAPLIPEGMSLPFLFPSTSSLSSSSHLVGESSASNGQSGGPAQSAGQSQTLSSTSNGSIGKHDERQNAPTGHASVPTFETAAPPMPESAHITHEASVPNEPSNEEASRLKSLPPPYRFKRPPAPPTSPSKISLRRVMRGEPPPRPVESTSGPVQLHKSADKSRPSSSKTTADGNDGSEGAHNRLMGAHVSIAATAHRADQAHASENLLAEKPIARVADQHEEKSIEKKLTAKRKAERREAARKRYEMRMAMIED